MSAFSCKSSVFPISSDRISSYLAVSAISGKISAPSDIISLSPQSASSGTCTVSASITANFPLRSGPSPLYDLTGTLLLGVWSGERPIYAAPGETDFESPVLLMQYSGTSEVFSVNISVSHALCGKRSEALIDCLSSIFFAILSARPEALRYPK